MITTAPTASTHPQSIDGTAPRRRRRPSRVLLAIGVSAALVAAGAQSASAAPGGKPPAAPARVATIQLGAGGALPVTVAASAWSKRSNVSIAVGDCSGPHCIVVSLVDTTPCDSATATMGAIGGCSSHLADGSCLAQVKTWLLPYPDALRAALEHEVGHCLGLEHNTTDARSIMSPVINLANPPSGPDSTDLANLRAVAW